MFCRLPRRGTRLLSSVLPLGELFSLSALCFSLSALCLGLCSCDRLSNLWESGPQGSADKQSAANSEKSDAQSNQEEELSIAEENAPPPPRVGMVYIPAGALVVGTPPGRLPRRTDRELAGEQWMLDGFYIDRFAFPNEEGGIPTTNVSRQEAARLCEAQEKRLCSELEWERACKGPENRVYEYGDEYDAEACQTGREAQLRPSGYHVACQSDFGVRDLHGGPFEWTLSPFGRGHGESDFVLKGGNSEEGEVIGRCANVEPADQERRSGSVGFRCCAGALNEQNVELNVSFSPGLIPRAKFDDDLEEALLTALPEDVRKDLRVAGPIRRQRVWLWRPVENEELYLSALCARGMPRPTGPRCGLLIARKDDQKVRALAWVASGRWVANLYQRRNIADLWLVGGDERGSFKRPMVYQYGDVAIFEQSRGAPKKD